MPTTVTRLYDDYFDARAVVAELEAIGVPQQDVSIIVNNSDRDHLKPVVRAEGAETGVVLGAALGAVSGGGIGVLAAFGIVAVPGSAAIVAAGWLPAVLFGTAAGATIGGLVGGLLGLLHRVGINNNDAQVYLEGVRRGGTMVSARINGRLFASAQAIFTHRVAVDPIVRGSRYRERGWTGFDAAAPDFTPQEVTRERDQHSITSKIG